MAKFPLQERYKTVLRAVVLFGLLAGLLFSSGEGIRLFPFQARETAQNEKAFLPNAEKSDYQENVLRFEKGEGRNSSKMQRAGKDFWTNEFGAPQKTPVFGLKAFLHIDSLQTAGDFPSRAAAQSVGSRAPPFS